VTGRPKIPTAWPPSLQALVKSQTAVHIGVQHEG
jgi:hypothetical protein